MSCISPTQIRSPNDPNATIYVPCGKCAWCAKRKRDEWYIRLKEEQKENPILRFLTLTYNNENIPEIYDENGEIHYTVNKKDIQKYMKKLRKQGYKFKYFVSSEYGSNTHRPHYHALMFSKEYYNYKDKWDKGFSVDVPARDSAIKYVCKYILKGSNVPDGSDKNFMLCSKNPAIGKGYIKDKLRYHLSSDANTYYTEAGGIKKSLPRYYRKKIWSKDNLDEKILKVHQDAIIEQLESSYKQTREKQIYLKNHENLDEFETWLNERYHYDLNKQIKINNKNE